MITRNPYKNVAGTIVRSYEDDLYYKGRFISTVVAKHIESQKTKDTIQITILPIIRLIIDSISGLYSEKVIRTINSDNEEIKSLFEKVCKSFDEKAVLVDKYTKLSGILALKSHYDAELDKLEYIIYDSSMISDYTPHPIDYTKYSELVLEYYLDGVRQNEFWGMNEYYRKIDDSKSKTEPNNYGFIPMTLFRDKELANSFYVAPTANLLDMQDFISMQLVQIGNNFKYQSMSMLVIKGGGSLEQLSIGASAVNQIGESDDMKFITPEIDLNGLVDTIDNELKLFCRANGIPDTLLSASVSSSGAAITISQKILDKYIKERSSLLINSEKQAILNGLKVLAYHNDIDLPYDLEISVTHTSANTATKLSQDEIMTNKFYLDNDIMTKVDLMIKLYPNMSESEAIAKLEKNKSINEKYGRTLDSEIAIDKNSQNQTGIYNG